MQQNVSNCSQIKQWKRSFGDSLNCVSNVKKVSNWDILSETFLRLNWDLFKQFETNLRLIWDTVQTFCPRRFIDSRGGATGARPLYILIEYVFFFQFCIRMHQIRLRYHERASKTLELSGPLSGPWTPAVMDFTLCGRNVRCVHLIFCAPSIWKSCIRPCNADLDKNKFYKIDCCAAIHGRNWLDNVHVPRIGIIKLCYHALKSVLLYIFSIVRIIGAKPGFPFVLTHTV